MVLFELLSSDTRSGKVEVNPKNEACAAAIDGYEICRNKISKQRAPVASTSGWFGIVRDSGRRRDDR